MVSWIDASGLKPLLDGGTRVSVVNEVETVDAAIAGVVVALHRPGAQPEIRRASELEIDAGETLRFADDRPLPALPVAAEATLRILAQGLGRIVEVYLRSDEARTEPAVAVQIGIVDTDDAPEQGAVAVPGVDGLSAYIKLEP